MQTNPTQADGLLKAAPVRTHGIPVHGAARNLGSPAAFDRIIQAADYRTSGDERSHEQA
jgi:hypothetical protein